MTRTPNEFPSDAAEIARLVRKADAFTAIKLLQVWGAKQRDLGGIKAIREFGESINAHGRTAQ